jgi:ABC-2 type transport system permease protein
MSRLPGVRLAAEVRHQTILLARDPGPMIGYLIMGLLLIAATRPLYTALDRLTAAPAAAGTDQAAAGMAVMFSLFGVTAAAFGLHPTAGWPALAACAVAWSACVLLLGTGASTLARTPAQLSAAGDIFALITAVLGGAIVPVDLLPGWLRHVAPASPGYWALDAYRCALAQLGRPLAVLGVFALAGAGIAALISARQHAPSIPVRPRPVW